MRYIRQHKYIDTNIMDFDIDYKTVAIIVVVVIVLQLLLIKFYVFPSCESSIDHKINKSNKKTLKKIDSTFEKYMLNQNTKNSDRHRLGQSNFREPLYKHRSANNYNNQEDSIEDVADVADVVDVADLTDAEDLDPNQEDQNQDMDFE